MECVCVFFSSFISILYETVQIGVYFTKTSLFYYIQSTKKKEKQKGSGYDLMEAIGFSFSSHNGDIFYEVAAEFFVPSATVKKRREKRRKDEFSSPLKNVNPKSSNKLVQTVCCAHTDTYRSGIPGKYCLFKIECVDMLLDISTYTFK